MLSRYSLRTRLLIVGFPLPIFILALLFIGYYFYSKQQTFDALLAKAQAITATAESARLNMEHKWEVGAFHSDQLVQWAQEGEKGKKKILEAVPVYSALRAAEMQSEQQAYTFNAPMVRARNSKHEATGRDIEALDALYAHQPTHIEGVANEYYFIDDRDGHRNLHYYRAVYLGETCMYCHGQPGGKEDIWDNDGIDGTGFPMDGKSVGDMHGAFMIKQELDEADEELAQSMLMAGLAIVVLLGIGGGAFALVISRAGRTSYSRYLDQFR